jgi:hypothetical protein
VHPADSEEVALTIVLTDDYLHPDLATLNQQHLHRQQPWLLVKPLGSVLWLGPVFKPGETGCWHCLAQRLEGNREVETSVQRQKQAAAANGSTPSSATEPSPSALTCPPPAPPSPPPSKPPSTWPPPKSPNTWSPAPPSPLSPCPPQSPLLPAHPQPPQPRPQTPPPAPAPPMPQLW